MLATYMLTVVYCYIHTYVYIFFHFHTSAYFVSFLKELLHSALLQHQPHVSVHMYVLQILSSCSYHVYYCMFVLSPNFLLLTNLKPFKYQNCLVYFKVQ